MFYTTHRIEHKGKLLAIEFHIRETIEEVRAMNPRTREVAFSSARLNAGVMAAAYGSCVAVMGIGYSVSTTPLPECTCQ